MNANQHMYICTVCYAVKEACLLLERKSILKHSNNLSFLYQGVEEDLGFRVTVFHMANSSPVCTTGASVSKQNQYQTIRQMLNFWKTHHVWVISQIQTFPLVSHLRLQVDAHHQKAWLWKSGGQLQEKDIYCSKVNLE